MQLENFDVDSFLSEYWQQKPLMIKNPWTAWSNPVEPDVLAGLSCEHQVESRLVKQSGDSWVVENGPLPTDRFAALGNQNWALLVQAVDHYVPAVAALINPFRFIPNWRIDDVMVSYAADGGGVGPHFDHYDVFLIQGMGKRRWQVGGMCDDQTALRPHDDLRLLARFDATNEWVMEPGDILYVPPGISHNGIAVGDDCMTYSIGFRAPSRKELIGYWVDDLLTEMADDDRYNDAKRNAQENPGEITADAINALHSMITETLADRSTFARWFGHYNSTPKYPDLDWAPEEPISAEQVRELMLSGVALNRNPASRFSFIKEGPHSLTFFADGESFDCANESEALARQLCAQDHLTVDTTLLTSGLLTSDLVTSGGAMALIVSLCNQGSLYFGSQQ